jgi:hypothetical protein
METVTLDKPLPAEISRRSSFPLMRFLSYPAFSWGWFWRRGIIFGIAGVAIGWVSGINVSIQLSDNALGWRISQYAIPLWVCLTLLGSALGTTVRHLRLEKNLERWLIPTAVVAATIIGVILHRLYMEFYRDNVMSAMLMKGFITQEMLDVAYTPAVRAVNSALLIAFVFVLSGGFGLRAYFRERRFAGEYIRRIEMQQLREQRDMSDRKLSLLQAQVEPHFLYNTLASVRSLVATDPSRAVATIDALVDHLRATLPKMRERDDARATLAEQIEICRSYLEVMRVRTGDRLRYSIDMPQDCGELFFPPLMLISLVENAIKHGVEPKPGPCVIAIVAQRSMLQGNESLEVAVLDDGAGLREGAGGGIGLANIRAQLATRYQDRAELSLQGRETGGVAARIMIPIEHS